MSQQEAESEGVQPNPNNNMPNSSSEDPIHPFPSNLRGSSHQSDHLSEPESEPEEEEEEAGSEGLQPNVSPSSQSNSSSDEPINQLPNESESESESEPEFESEPEIWTAELRKKYQSLHDAAKIGDRGTAISFIENDPDALAAKITADSKTVFHVAALCDQWEFILKLLELALSPESIAESIAVQDNYGCTVLHYVALGGSLETTEALVQKNGRLPQILNEKGRTPLLYSIWGENKELVRYLSTVTRVNLSLILVALIESDFLDIALDIFRSDPNMALANVFIGNSLLYWLANNPSYFCSGSNLGLIERWIYKFVDHGVEIKYPATQSEHPPTQSENPPTQSVMVNMEDRSEGSPPTQSEHPPTQSEDPPTQSVIVNMKDSTEGSPPTQSEHPPTQSVIVNMKDSTEGSPPTQSEHPPTQSEDTMEDSTPCCPALQPTSLVTRVLQWFKRLLWRAIVQLAPSVNKVRDAKLKHECAVELVNLVCTQLQNSNMSFQEIEHFLTNPNSLDLAIKNGIVEIVRTLLLQFPDLISIRDVRHDHDRNILQAAIEYRQENIVNVIKEISTTTTKYLGAHGIESDGITIHLAGKLAPPLKLSSVSGAALQLQRELQWFKEVEKITFTFRREWRNKDNKTPKDIFRTEHENLAKDGEKWMKGTAESCMIVATLIATVLFAAAFTVPGGQSDKGIAIFLHTNAFMIFGISVALGLSSSLTSLLMFLAILTARYELDEFLESLPKRLIIGLGSLFIAIATMIIAFGASLSIVLGQRWNWVFVPITLVAFIPVAIFVKLQLPLFVQMVQSTYGASIFRPWPSKKFE